MSYRSPFFTIPSRIMDLPGLTLAFLKFYETIFQFWHHDEECYLSNSMIKNRTGISSSSTIKEAFEFFEKHKEMKRVYKDGRRFIEQPIRSIEIQKEDAPLSLEREPPSRHSETPPLARARHNKNNINNKNINKSFVPKIPNKKNLCPLDFKPNEHHYKLGQELRVNVDEKVPEIIDWSHSKGEKRLDWDRTFNNWLRNEIKFNKRGQYAKESGAEIMHRVCESTIKKLKTQFSEFDRGLDKSIIPQT